MVYELMVMARSSSSSFLDTLQSSIPSESDNKIWPNDYRIDRGDTRLYISIRFNQEADRTDTINQIQALNLDSNLDNGSLIAVHPCGHKTGDECGQPITIWEKV